jgi:heme/copper-type cytochrome/quinol oxidase subunit 2
VSDPYQQQPEHQQSWQQQPQAWQQPPAAPYAAQARNPFDSDTTLILVMGILSLVVCGLLGIVAWIQGNSLKGRAEAAGWPEPTMGKVGRILGIIGTVLGALQIAFGVIWLIFVFGIMGAASTTG